MRKLEETDHDPNDMQAAITQAMTWDEEIPIGLFYHDTSRSSLEELEPVLHEGVPLAHQQLGITKEQGDAIIRKMM